MANYMDLVAAFMSLVIREAKADQHKRCVGAVMGFVRQASLGMEIEAALCATLRAIEPLAEDAEHEAAGKEVSR